MIKACVIGHPIKHSRSPLIHGYWLESFDIKGNYTREDIGPEHLPDFFQRLRSGEFAGCNVTLPHKESSCALVDHTDERVRRTGSLNTIYVRNGQLHATSTDGEGFIANVVWRVPNFQFHGANIVLIGAGGSAKALVDEMLQVGAEKIFIANRTLAKAQSIAATYGAAVTAIDLNEVSTVLAASTLLINTTSAGIANSGTLNIDFQRLQPSTVVADINYVPLITPFLIQAKAAGLQIVPGLGMLLHQAVRGFELWFGQRPAVTQELYDIVARNIDPGYRL